MEPLEYMKEMVSERALKAKLQHVPEAAEMILRWTILSRRHLGKERTTVLELAK
jgi:hypothetical protein